MANKKLRCCGTCARWLIAPYLHCQHSGYYGGNLPNVSHCKWTPLNLKKMPMYQENNGKFKYYVIYWSPRDNKKIRESWEWQLYTVPNKKWRWVDYKEARQELKIVREKFPQNIFRLVKIQEKQTYLEV